MHILDVLQVLQYVAHNETIFQTTFNISINTVFSALVTIETFN